MRLLVPAVALALLLVLAGCTSGATPTPGSGPAGGPSATATATPTATPTDSPTATTVAHDSFADPEGDPLGWEQGYWHDEPLAVTPGDGLNDSEFAAVKARAMARVEVVRGLEFRSDVAFEFRTREEYQFPVRESDWRDGYWAALFVVGDDRSAAAAYDELYDVVVDGAAYGGERIVMLVEDPGSPRVNTTVLAHELVHAVESQHGVYGPPADRRSHDAWQARSAAVEGSAVYFERRYVDRCGASWDCIQAPVTAGVPPGADDVNMGLYLDFAMRYTAGESFVAALADRGGRDAVTGMQAAPPASTAAVLHPERYPGDGPAAVTVENRTAGDWRRWTRGDDGPAWGTVGEARLYAMLWHNGVVDEDLDVAVTVGQQVPTDYRHPATDGWAGDRLVLYTNGSAEGFVLRTRWASERDVVQFRDAYVELLRVNGAERVDDGTYVVASGRFDGAYRVTASGTTLTVVGAPAVDALGDVHAPAAAA